ncbi:FAD:protein FMN transferase [Cohnella candidum]|nr:FAD:protein FMN transferase [Cohnella candidum]
MAALTLTMERFRAMNTDVTVALALEPSPAGESAFREAGSWFAYAERVFSRFRPDSELSGLNLSAGLPVRISKTMEEVLELARHYQRVTNGMFDPGILPQLLQAGYTVSFERIASRERGMWAEQKERGGSRKGDWKLFGPLQTVRLDPGTRIDLGGIVKGWAVDRLADRLIAKGIAAGMVNAGGDLRVWGNADSPDWEIEIDDPREPGACLSVAALRKGAVATSSVLGRSWQTAEGRKHHLIDPRTGKPSESDVLQCTVAGDTAVESEIAAKTVCMLGSKEGAEWLREACPRSDAFLLTRDGERKLLRSDVYAAGTRNWKGE